MSTDAPTRLGFPPPLLGDRPARVPVVWNHPLGFALDKPVGVQVLADNWFPKVPVLTEAINYQVAQGKGELRRLGLGDGEARAIFQSEPEMAGLTLFAKDSETGAFWSNACGSDQFEFTVHFLSAKAPQGAESLECDLPIARHGGREQCMLVSHRTGKKTQTRFQFLGRRGRYSLWEAKTPFLRVNHIPLHAFEVGLAVVGDQTYAGESPFYLSMVKRDFRLKRSESEAPLYEGSMMFLAGLKIPMPDGESVMLQVPPPKRFTAVMRNLERYSRV
jgi:23S rRNA-/tRNA-specific pseudouridylate synthase